MFFFFHLFRDINNNKHSDNNTSLLFGLFLTVVIHIYIFKGFLEKMKNIKKNQKNRKKSKKTKKVEKIEKS